MQVSFQHFNFNLAGIIHFAEWYLTLHSQVRASLFTDPELLLFHWSGWFWITDWPKWTCFPLLFVVCPLCLSVVALYFISKLDVLNLTLRTQGSNLFFCSSYLASLFFFPYFCHISSQNLYILIPGSGILILLAPFDCVHCDSYVSCKFQVL